PSTNLPLRIAYPSLNVALLKSMQSGAAKATTLLRAPGPKKASMTLPSASQIHGLKPSQMPIKLPKVDTVTATGLHADNWLPGKLALHESPLAQAVIAPALVNAMLAEPIAPHTPKSPEILTPAGIPMSVLYGIGLLAHFRGVPAPL